ncbi:hypothetical protein WOLCODRAFT_156227 [Wolfiporia cocos MD-104 SS10]|uniref:Uncharacterized protein n=1 Tax=Wolfiporia cocos (strain MD-104) TaxID=742152 RepID=A0A2H3JFP6_WOLCO|nr:hypothetical protein WOLCODRAFT_156227 [Wolfiporia cocos MD-104 SS10]
MHAHHIPDHQHLIASPTSLPLFPASPTSHQDPSRLASPRLAAHRLNDPPSSLQLVGTSYSTLRPLAQRPTPSPPPPSDARRRPRARFGIDILRPLRALPRRAPAAGLLGARSADVTQSDTGAGTLGGVTSAVRPSSAARRSLPRWDSHAGGTAWARCPDGVWRVASSGLGYLLRHTSSLWAYAARAPGARLGLRYSTPSHARAYPSPDAHPRSVAQDPTFKRYEIIA